jgi:predicted Zn-dependent protease
LDVFFNYRIVIQEAEKHWENEIKDGLSDGRYTDNINDVQYSRIKTIFDNLLSSQYLEQNKRNWKIYLHNSNDVNAFAVLDGVIILNKGIVDFCRNDDELALVIGHEMAHVTESHYSEQRAEAFLKRRL